MTVTTHVPTFPLILYNSPSIIKVPKPSPHGRTLVGHLIRDILPKISMLSANLSHTNHLATRRDSPSLLLKHLPSRIRDLLVRSAWCIDAELLLSGRET